MQKKKLIDFFAKVIHNETLDVIKKSISTLIVKIFGVIVSLLVSIYLGRTLGIENFGVFNLAYQITFLISVLIIFGMENVLIKRIAIGYKSENYQLIKDTLYTSLKFNLIISICVVLLLVFLSDFLAYNVFDKNSLKFPLIFLAISLIPDTVNKIFSSALNGIGKIWQSILFQQVLIICFVGLGLLLLAAFGVRLNIVLVSVFYVLGRLINSVVLIFFWKSKIKLPSIKNWDLQKMLIMALPLLLVSASRIIIDSSDTIMLGWLSNSKNVGLYSVASKIIGVTNLIFVVSNSAISPKIASMYAKGDLKNINLMIKQVTGGLMIISVFIFIFIFIFGKSVLGLWGVEYTEAYIALVILFSGQLVNMSIGCTGLLLIMCGYEKEHGYISLFCVLLNLCLNYFLILEYGLVGAAASTALTIIISSILKLIVTKIKLGILAIPLFK